MVLTFLSLAAHTVHAQQAKTPAPYTLKGDLADIKRKGFLRILFHGEADHLPRNGDPRAAERALAEELAARLGVTPTFISVAEQDDLITELNDGHGDMIIGSLAITAERSKRVAFSRPIRFVDQLVIVRTSDTSVQELADLAGRDVTVRESSSYAEALRAAKVAGIRIKPAPETMQTLDLLEGVERGEEKITVADSDLFATARAFAPNIKSAFRLVERQPIGWGLRKTNPDLKAAIDSYLVEFALTHPREDAYRTDLDDNRNKWFGNVEQAMLLLSKREIAKKARYGFCRCEEPVKYVSEIQDRYDHYGQIVPMR
jgi:membrane-bound lytic murein transglycosylase F